MFWKLLQFEWKYLTRQIVFHVFVAILLLIGIASFIDLPSGIVYANAPYRISFFIGIISIGSVFPILFFTIKMLLRDRTHKFEDLIFGTPLLKWYYFFSKFVSVFVATTLVMSSSILGFYLGQFFDEGYLNLGTSSLRFYFWPWLLILFPNIFVGTTVIFSITLLTRRIVHTYAAGIFLLALFWIGSFYINSPLTGGRVLASPNILNVVAVIDFFGLAAFFEQTQFWTIHEKNSLLLRFSGYLLWNRVLWIGLSITGITMTYIAFTFRRKNETQTRKRNSIETASIPKKYYSVKPITNTFKSEIKAFYTLLKIDVKSLFLSKIFLAFLLIWMLINVMSMYFMVNGEAEFGDRYPTTELLVGLISEPASLLGLLLMLFYAGELIWKRRVCKFNEILDTTPLTNGAFLFAKYATLSIIIIVLLTLGIWIGIGCQISRGYYQFNLPHYFSMYYFTGIPLLLIGGFAIFLQVIISRKYIAMIAAGILLLFFSQLAPIIGIEDPMLRYLQFPRIDHRYSDMTGYGQYAKPFHALCIYWFTLTAILILVSVKCLRRGTNLIQIQIRALFSKNWSGLERSLLSFFALLFLVTGGYIYYNLHTNDPSPVSKDEYWFNEQYERKFKQFESLPIPQVVEVKTQVDIFPKERRYKVAANYLIENTSDQVIKEIFVCTRLPLQSLAIENSKLTMRDSILKSYRFRLINPLKPKEQLKMTFQLEEQVKGFATSMTILTNGSYIPHYAFDPLLGYADFLEINDPAERQKRGLPARKKMPYNDPHLLDGGKFTTMKVNYESIISTSEDQTAITSGKLVRRWHEKGRNYFQYQATPKIRRNMTYISAHYDTMRRSYKGVNLEMYYHPGHYHNIESMLQYAENTLDYAKESFSPYQHDYLRIVEVASGRGFGGQAMPGVISLSEKSMYTKDVRNPEKGINVVARRTIHEVAHQWWSHQLTPKRVAGASLLTEALCKYTEAVVLERLYGKAMVRKLSDYTARRYFAGRSYARSSEPPLYLTERQSYLGYSKGYMILYALKELLGEDTINQALQNVLQQHNGERPTATSLDLINEIYAVAPPIYHSLIEDWMKRVITYDLSIEKSSYQLLSNGQYEITFQVSARRFETQSSGEEKAIPINEPIQIGLFAKHPNEMKKEDNALYLQNHWISQPDTTIKITSDKLPLYIGIDPYLTRLDKDRQDNLRIL